MNVSVIRLLCGAILAATVAGCANTPKAKGIPWWPQGPGISSDDLLRTAKANVVQSVTHTDPTPSSSTQPTDRFDQAVRYGDLLFVSGQIAVDPVSHAIVGTDIRAQVRTAMDNVMGILESHGLAAGNILSVTMYMLDIDDLPKADSVYASYFRATMPARSVVHVSGLAKGSLVAISVIAGK
jgi:2-iminobutanoate/2-iminopropanoate deaminase